VSNRKENLACILCSPHKDNFLSKWRHDIQQNDTRHNDTQHNNLLFFSIKSTMLSIVILCHNTHCHYSVCCYAKCCLSAMTRTKTTLSIMAPRIMTVCIVTQYNNTRHSELIFSLGINDNQRIVMAPSKSSHSPTYPQPSTWAYIIKLFTVVIPSVAK